MTDNLNLLIDATSNISKHISEGKHKHYGKYITDEDRVSAKKHFRHHRHHYR
jgi:hypothetical protein